MNIIHIFPNKILCIVVFHPMYHFSRPFYHASFSHQNDIQAEVINLPRKILLHTVTFLSV